MPVTPSSQVVTLYDSKGNPVTLHISLMEIWGGPFPPDQSWKPALKFNDARNSMYLGGSGCH